MRHRFCRTLAASAALATLFSVGLTGHLQVAAGQPACPAAPPLEQPTPGSNEWPDGSLVATIPTGALPAQVVIDATDSRGRIFVTDTGWNTLTLVENRSTTASIFTAATVAWAGAQPFGLALNGLNGRVYVTSVGDCTLRILDSRADIPGLLATIQLGATPAGVAVDPISGRVFVAEPATGSVEVFEPNGSGLRSVAWAASGGNPYGLAIDAERGLLVVTNFKGPAENPDLLNGSVGIIDARATLPRLVAPPLPADGPKGIAIDPVSGLVFVTESGADRVMTLRLTASNQPSVVSRVSVALGEDLLQTIDPTAVTYLPQRHQLVVALQGAFNAILINVAPDGSLSVNRPIDGVAHAVGVALDPVTGRVYLVERDLGDLRVFDLEVPGPLALPFVLPGPLDISLLPRDVARSVGLTLLVMLLVGAPSHLFNSTLDANQAEIRRKLRFGRRGRLAVAARWAGRRPIGAVLYLAVAATLYAFLDRSFPGHDGLLILGATAVGITVSTSLAVLPGDRYVWVRFARHGRFRVAGWTLGIAAVCVAVARLTAIEPGYVYGIIGVFAYTVPLDRIDRGRMAWRGSLLLLAVGLAAWFARIPFQPAPGQTLEGFGLAANKVLVTLFVISVEGLVFGMAPLRFLPGARLRDWSRVRWLALWAIGLLLFAHVIVYPVSSYEPNPSAVGLWTVVATVSIYGAVAVGFWAYFRFRPVRAGQFSGELTGR